MGSVNSKEQLAPHALDDLVARVGKNNPKALEAIVSGTSNDELIEDGASIATPRIVVDAVRLYGEALDFFDRATPAQKTLLRGASVELIGIAVHHLNALRKLEASGTERSQGTSADRAVVTQDLQDALSAAIVVRDQAYRAMRDASRIKRYTVQLDEAFGVADPPEKLAAGLAAMAQLLRTWLGSDDGALVARLDLAHLDKAYANELNDAALSVRKSLAAAAKRTSSKAHQAELDREDGVQILLLGQIIRAFESAHARDATIPRLVPISTRRLFSRRFKKSADAAAPAASPTAAPAPAPTDTPAARPVKP